MIFRHLYGMTQNHDSEQWRTKDFKREGTMQT